MPEGAALPQQINAETEEAVKNSIISATGLQVKLTIHQEEPEEGQ